MSRSLLKGKAAPVAFSIDGESVFLRRWNVADLKRFMASQKAGAEIETAVVLSLCDAGGNPTFTMEDLPAIASEMPGTVAMKIAAEALTLNGMTQSGIDAEKKD